MPFLHEMSSLRRIPAKSAEAPAPQYGSCLCMSQGQEMVAVTSSRWQVALGVLYYFPVKATVRSGSGLCSTFASRSRVHATYVVAPELFVTSTPLDKTAPLHYLNASLDGPTTMSFPEGMDIVFHDLSVTSFHLWVPSIAELRRLLLSTEMATGKHISF
jgi:hypothetical protein